MAARQHAGSVLFSALAVGASALFGTAGAANGATIDPGLYRLHNHPDGKINPPPYGARLDEIYDVTMDRDSFTLDFDHADSAVFLDYDGSRIHIYGVARGGRDIGPDYAMDAYLGLWTIDFVYDTGLGLVPGDDDLYVVNGGMSGLNFGSVMTPIPDTFELSDKHDATLGYVFRLGDEDDDLGHRGFTGISGWGWFMIGDTFIIGADDWLFTAELVPTPGSGVLGLAAGAIVLARRRR